MATGATAIYELIYSVLSNDAYILARVPVTNIKPNYDQLENNRGNAIVYGWAEYTQDSKSKRASGAIELQIASKDKLVLTEIVERTIQLLNPRNLTDRTILIVAKFQTTGGTNDSSVDQFNRNVAVINFDVRTIDKA